MREYREKLEAEALAKQAGEAGQDIPVPPIGGPFSSSAQIASEDGPLDPPVCEPSPIPLAQAQSPNKGPLSEDVEINSPKDSAKTSSETSERPQKNMSLLLPARSVLQAVLVRFLGKRLF